MGAILRAMHRDATRAARSLALLLLFGAVGCGGAGGGDRDASSPMDADTGAMADAAADARADARVDGNVDGATDAGTDSGMDAGTDAGMDSGTDSGLCPPLEASLASPGDPIDGDTWDSFARDFFGTYCTRCHSTALTTDAERMGAPPVLDWDDPVLVRMYAGNIRYDVGVSDYMPRDAPLPSCDERYRIVRWIDADAP